VEEVDRAAVDFLEEVFQRMNLPCEVQTKSTPDSLQINLVGDNMGSVIGRHGETLDALQYLTSLVANRRGGEYRRISIDTENYRKKREDTLAALAKRLAAKAVKHRRNVTLEPMNAYERRIIHATLQGYDHITTFSTGSEPNRRVVVSYTADRNANSRDKA
jgi:spoIIIJ-associated protein